MNGRKKLIRFPKSEKRENDARAVMNGIKIVRKENERVREVNVNVKENGTQRREVQMASGRKEMVNENSSRNDNKNSDEIIKEESC